MIRGTVTNGTAGGGGVEGQTVTLHRVTATGFKDLTTTTGADGTFAFDGVEFDSETAYGVSVRYQDAIYGTDLDLAAGSPEPVELTVYESTQDDSIVSTASASLLLASADGSDQTLAALEILKLSNRSDRAYVPGSGVMEVLRFGLPPGATDLSLDTRLIGADFIQVDRGFALLASIPPGEHEVMFSYRFPYDNGNFTLQKTYRYGVDALRVLAPEEVVTISALALGEPETVLIGERAYLVIEAEGLERGAAISIHLDGLPMPTVGQRMGQALSGIRFEYAAPVALGVLMLALLVYGAVWKSTTRRSETTVPVADDDRMVIREMIAELRDSYRSGSLSEDDFRRRLRVLNARLSRAERT